LNCAPLYLLALLFLSLHCVAAGPAAVGDQLLSGTSGETDWPRYGRLFDQQRFSPLTEIDTTNVTSLGLVASLELPDARPRTGGHRGAAGREVT
jgi:quinohemoprotein ethanol dehydrogenase